MTSAQLTTDFASIEGKYLLGRNFAAASRLNLQFYLWKVSLGFNLHPSIVEAVDDGQSLSSVRVADVATGTGIWLMDLASELPRAQMTGLDISLANAPNPAYAPSNVVFRQWNVFDEPSAELIEAFDVVHLRLLVLVARESDPMPIIRNVLKLLKPGGWLQWDDLNYPETHIKKPPHIRSTPMFDQLKEYVYCHGAHDWIMRLPSFFREQDMVQCSIESYVDPQQLTRANGDQHLLTMSEFADQLEEQGRKGDASRVRGMLASLQVEAAQGAALSMPRAVCIGRKKWE